MKRFFEYLGLSAIILFSFYYTEKVVFLSQSKNTLIIAIKEAAIKEDVKAVNAEILGNNIVPGVNGEKVNIQKSYYKMKNFGIFNHYYLVFDEIKPDISVEKNKEKIIIKGHKSKNSVSLVIDNNEAVKKFMEEQKIPSTIITYLDSYKNTLLEQINGESDKTKFNNLESILNKNKKNVHLCLKNNSNKEICLKNNNYLVKESLYLSSINFVQMKSQIESGVVILIKEGAKVEDVNLLLRQIAYQGLKITYLSELLSEK